MQVRVKGLAGLGGHAHQIVAGKGRQQRLLGQFQPRHQTGGGTLGILGGGLQGALQIVGHAQQVAGETLDGIGPRVIVLGLGPTLDVLDLGHGAQRPVLPLVPLVEDGVEVVHAHPCMGRIGIEARLGVGLIGRIDAVQVVEFVVIGVVRCVVQGSCPSNSRLSTRAV